MSTSTANPIRVASSNKTTFNISLFGEVLADIFSDRSVLGGAPYNVTRHLKAFNQRPVLISRVGKDALKDELFAELTRLDIDASGIQSDPAFPTGQVVVHMEENGHSFEIMPDQAYDHIDVKLAQESVISKQPDLVYFGTLAQRSTESRAALEAFLKNTNCPKFLDINLRAPWYTSTLLESSLLSADIAKLNEEELILICDLLNANAKGDKERGLFLIEKFNLSMLLITCGEAGAWAINNDGTDTCAGAPKLESKVVDTVGAGDGFSAICILGILHQWPTDVILKRANIFAANICQIRGAAPDNNDFYSVFLKDWMAND